MLVHLNSLCMPRMDSYWDLRCQTIHIPVVFGVIGSGKMARFVSFAQPGNWSIFVLAKSNFWLPDPDAEICPACEGTICEPCISNPSNKLPTCKGSGRSDPRGAPWRRWNGTVNRQGADSPEGTCEYNKRPFLWLKQYTMASFKKSLKINRLFHLQNAK